MDSVGLTLVLFPFFRCVDLVAELSQNPKAQKEVFNLIPLMAQAAHFKHYTQHLHLLETVCTQVTNFMIAMLHYRHWYFSLEVMAQGYKGTITVE